MDQCSEQKCVFPGNLVELTDSQPEHLEDVKQTKPPLYFSDRTLRKKKWQEEKELFQQLAEDPVYQSCIDNHSMFYNYLHEKGYKDIYQYLKYCNKKGILLEDEVLKKYNIKPVRGNYNIHQCRIIHKKNTDYKNLELVLKNLKQISKTLKLEEKINKNQNIEYFNSEEATTIYQAKQHRYLAPNVINTILYDVTPLDQKIDESIIKQCWIQYEKFYNKSLKEYNKECNSDSDEEDTSIIDYDQISNDSLAPNFLLPPSRRAPQYHSMSLSFQVQQLRILRYEITLKTKG